MVADAEDVVADSEEVVAGSEVGEAGAKRCCLSSEEEAVAMEDIWLVQRWWLEKMRVCLVFWPVDQRRWWLVQRR